jgi:hypothetical protein
MDNICRKLIQLGLTVNRDNYVALAYLGQKEYEELEGEERYLIPDIFDEETGELIQ